MSLSPQERVDPHLSTFSEAVRASPRGRLLPLGSQLHDRDVEIDLLRSSLKGLSAEPLGESS